MVDATHPFAERISASAARAAPAAGVPLLRLERPAGASAPATAGTGSPTSTRPPRPSRGSGERVLLTTGRQGLAAFAGVDDAWFLVRCVDPPGPPLPARHELLLDRGPYTLDGRAGARRAPRDRPGRHQGQRRHAHRGQARRGARARAAGDRRAPPAAARRPDRGLRRGGAGLGARSRRVAPRRVDARRLARDRARRRGPDDQQRAHVDGVEVERRRAS